MKTKETPEDRRDRLRMSGTLIALLGYGVIRATRLADGASRKVRRRICRAGRWTIRDQAKAAVQSLAVQEELRQQAAGGGPRAV